MSKQNRDNPDEKGSFGASISAEVHVATHKELDRLSDLTGQSMSHHIRRAIMLYLTSDEIAKQVEEAERFARLTRSVPATDGNGDDVPVGPLPGVETHAAAAGKAQ